ncbi:NUDIX domain-containing protein [Patescibacteria group bacterium]|nr:NUDIX domain-containing protein [Patescibacteria group bacterium]MBU1890720.1 NUDIX domain-containing protein [Patescibacteria group bacterium]
MENRPKVGVGVCIIKDGKVLWGKRKNSHGASHWCFPGGHLEFNESWEECAKRETLEETNLHIKNVRFATATNDTFSAEKKHYVTIFMLADFDSGELKCMEPEKCDEWDWFDWDNPPQPLFESEVNLYKQEFNPFKPASN